MLARLVELLPAIIKKTGSGIERGAILVILVNTLFMLAILAILVMLVNNLLMLDNTWKQEVGT